MRRLPMFRWPSDPDLLFDAARDMRCYQLPFQGKTRYFLIFARRAEVIDEELAPKRGVLLALFECDEDGAVSDWNQRFEVDGRNLNAAFYRFEYRFVNGLISPVDVRRASSIDEDELDQLDAMMSGEESDSPYDDD